MAPRTDQWICPDCDRPFKRANQQHVCAPSMSVDQYFEGRASVDREIFEAVAAALDACGPIEIEAVSIGILFKTTRSIVELRPRRVGMAISMVLPGELPTNRVTKRIKLGEHSVVNFITLTSGADVDDELIGWIQDTYDYGERST